MTERKTEADAPKKKHNTTTMPGRQSTLSNGHVAKSVTGAEAIETATSIDQYVGQKLQKDGLLQRLHIDPLCLRPS